MTITGWDTQELDIRRQCFVCGALRGQDMHFILRLFGRFIGWVCSKECEFTFAERLNRVHDLKLEEMNEVPRGNPV